MSPISVTRKTILLEILFLTGLFYLFGGWPVPDVNEQYYIGKAIHFWNRDWLPNDWFLDTPDSHWFFYGSFGIFSLFLSPVALTWFGRWLIWGLTAWSWRRLSFALIPKPGFSILTAAALLFLLDSFHLAGEWIVGGVEGKGFAFPFVFLGLEAFFKNRSNLCWVYWGIASAFHVLVGGWTVLAALLVWMIQEMKSPRMLGRHFCHILPGLFLGGSISLLGLIPALLLDKGASAETIRNAHQIYVFERLSHHLVPSSLSWIFLTRFALLVLAFGILLVYKRFSLFNVPSFFSSSNKFSQHLSNQKERQTLGFRFDAFILVAILFAVIGLFIDFGIHHQAVSSELLRFYWFRLSDWAVPFGVVFACFSLFIQTFESIFFSHLPFIFKANENLVPLGTVQDNRLLIDGNSNEKFSFDPEEIDARAIFSPETRFSQISIQTENSNHLKEKFLQQLSFNVNRFLYSVLIWLSSSTIAFMIFKHFFRIYSQKQAETLSEGGNWLFMPKPVDGIAFLTTINFVLGFILMIYLVVLSGYFLRSRLAAFFYWLFFKTQKFQPADSSCNNQSVISTESRFIKIQKESPFFHFLINEGRMGLLFTLTILVLFAPIYYSVGMLQTRTSTIIPRSNPLKESISNGWFDVCHWVRQNTNSNAIFLVPRSCESFKWNANRAEVGNWKEIPQDASSIVQWFQRMNLFYTIPGNKESTRWNQPLIVVLISKGLPKVQKECEKYHIDYIIAEMPPYALTSYEKAMKRYQDFSNCKVYQNNQFVVFDMRKDSIRKTVRN